MESVAQTAPHPPDADLVRAALAGDTASFGVLIKRHFQMVYAIGLARLRDPDRAEDLAQEVFLRAQLHLQQLGPTGNFGGWVCRIARNLAINWLRQGQRASRLLPLVPLEEEAMRSPDHDAPNAREALGTEESLRALNEALASLPNDQREMVLLHFMSGATQREIAERLSVNQATVSRQIQRALKSLRGSLGPMLREAAPALRAPDQAVAKSLLIATAVGAMSVTAKTSLAASASLGQLVSVAQTVEISAAGALGAIGFFKSLPAIIAGGVAAMSTGSKITLAIAAVVIAGGGAYHFTKSGTFPYPYAFNETVQSPDGDSYTNHRMALAPGHYRDERTNGIFIWDLENHPNQYLLLDPARQLAILTTLNDPTPPSDLIQEMRNIQASDASVEIGPDGGAVRRFDTELVHVQFDAESGLPTQFELTPPNGVRITRSDFQFGADLDPSLFSMTPPAGYEVVERENINRIPTEQMLIDGLRAAAEYTGGVFPTDFGRAALRLMGGGIESRAQGMTPEEIEHLREIVDTFSQGIRFPQYIVMQNGEWHWEGEGVQLGDSSSVVCWWKLPDEDVRHEVYGDLSVRTITDTSPVQAESPDSPQAHIRTLVDALRASDRDQVESLFLSDEQIVEISRRLGQPSPSPADIQEMRGENERMIGEVSDLLHAAQSVELVGVRERGQPEELYGFEDRREDVAIDLLVDGRPTSLFINVMIKMDGRWYFLDGPVVHQ